MATLSEDQARDYLHTLLAAMARAGGSDLFIAHDFPPSMKSHGHMVPLTLHDQPTPAQVEAIRREELRKQQEKRDEIELAQMQAAKQKAQASAAG